MLMHMSLTIIKYNIIIIETSHPVERSARNNSPCRDWLETNHPVERSGENSAIFHRVSARNKLPCGEFTYAPFTM